MSLPLSTSGPFARYLARLLADLSPSSRGSPGSTAICLGAFARMGRLHGSAPRVARALADSLRRGGGDEVDRWLCAAALRKTVCAEPDSCAFCSELLRRLAADDSRSVAADATAALAFLQSRQVVGGSARPL